MNRRISMAQGLCDYDLFMSGDRLCARQPEEFPGYWLGKRTDRLTEEGTRHRVR